MTQEHEAGKLAAFRPALLVVDLQEDFCPPSGSLATPSGRAIIPIINTLLSHPFTLKLATKDWHPRSHVSFAANHPAAIQSANRVAITNPRNPEESYETPLWPVHCVQGTPGAEFAKELEEGKLDGVVEKGQVEGVECFSGFGDAFKHPQYCDTGLTKMLRVAEVSHVYVTGLAFDFCVQATAIDAAKEGFTTYVIREGTKAAFPDGWEETETALMEKGVKLVDMSGEEVERVRRLGMEKQ